MRRLVCLLVALFFVLSTGVALAQSPPGPPINENWHFGVVRWIKHHDKWTMGSWYSEKLTIVYGIFGNDSNPPIDLEQNLEIDNDEIETWDDDGNNWYTKSDLTDGKIDTAEEFRVNCVGTAKTGFYNDSWITHYNNQTVWDKAAVATWGNLETSNFVRHPLHNPPVITCSFAKPVWYRVPEYLETKECRLRIYKCTDYFGAVAPAVPPGGGDPWAGKTWAYVGVKDIENGSCEGAELFYLVAGNVTHFYTQGPTVTFTYDPTTNQTHWFRWELWSDRIGWIQEAKTEPFSLYVPKD